MQGFWGRFCESFPAFAFFKYFFSGDQFTAPISFFMLGSVHSGSASEMTVDEHRDNFIDFVSDI